MDNRCQIDIIFLDFAKAFDRVPYQCLLSRLSAYGITDNGLELTQQFLQFVLDSTCSTSALVKFGVPQGSYGAYHVFNI